MHMWTLSTKRRSWRRLVGCLLAAGLAFSDTLLPVSRLIRRKCFFEPTVRRGWQIIASIPERSNTLTSVFVYEDRDKGAS